MPSSISNSEPVSAERLTASDRPGVAQPVPERPVPAQPWRLMLVCVVVLGLLATVVWEWRMRALALLPGDIDDGPSAWAQARRQVDAGGVPVAIVGDSRILFNTDPDRFQALTGVRPLQLSYVGTNALFLLENLAEDDDFTGLLIVGIADGNYFREEVGLGGAALARYRYESPAEHSAQFLHVTLSRWFGFLDDSYRLSRLLTRLDTGARAGTRGPYDMPWKLATSVADRNIKMWSRIEAPGFLQDHARAVWMNMQPRQPLTEELIADHLRRTRVAVASIRTRGGEVVFLRPPSNGPLRERELQRFPHEQFWDSLLHVADVRGVHFEDDPAMQGLNIPEWSHLSAACATVYTDAYVRALTRITPRLALRPDAPPALAAADCVSTLTAGP